MTEVIDSNESVVNRYRYTPFGQSIEKDESVYNPYQYTGRRYDEERGNYYYRARIYDQQQSRFLSNDPAGQGANLYAYVGNNPTNRRDPSGELVYSRWPAPPLRVNRDIYPGARMVDGSGATAYLGSVSSIEGGGGDGGGKTDPGLYKVEVVGIRVGWKLVTTNSLTKKICTWMGLGIAGGTLVTKIVQYAGYLASIPSGVGGVIVANELLTCTCGVSGGRMIYYYIDFGTPGMDIPTSYCDW